MTVFNTPKLFGFDNQMNLLLDRTHSEHMAFQQGMFVGQGSRISEMGKQIGADTVARAGTFQDAMLHALDKVSAQNQFASNLHQAAITDPDSVNAHDITIAQAQANMSLNITRNVLNRLVQGLRDIINIR